MPLEENVSFSTSSLVGPESQVIKASVSCSHSPSSMSTWVPCPLSQTELLRNKQLTYFPPAPTAVSDIDELVINILLPMTMQNVLSALTQVTTTIFMIQSLGVCGAA